MDRMRRYVCAFTQAVDIASTTESCKDGLPVPEPQTPAKTGGAGSLVIDVDLPWSGAASAPDGRLVDRGVFQLIERDPVGV
jgi:hypothetical protein